MNNKIKTGLCLDIIPQEVKDYVKRSKVKGLPYVEGIVSIGEHVIEQTLGINVTSIQKQSVYVQYLQLVYATAYYINLKHKLGFPIKQFEKPFTAEGVVDLLSEKDDLYGEFDVYGTFYYDQANSPSTDNRESDNFKFE